MKRFLVLTLAGLCLFTGCEKVEEEEKGLYKEGVYEGSFVDTYGGEQNLATAKIVVNAKGDIESVYLDTEYQGSTKKTLGDDYNMKKYQPDAAGEWYEQVEKLEKAIVENQGTDFITLDEENKTDAVSGCTIVIDALLGATNDALEKAKN
jgi:major membrane immunogen (membrane-anchored lipoprotein)